MTTLPPALAALLAPQPMAVAPPSRGVIGPYVHVFTNRGDAGSSKRNAEIIGKLGHVPEGTPILWTGGAEGTWALIPEGTPFVILKEVWFWTLYCGGAKSETCLGDKKPINRPAGVTNKWDEAVACMLVLLTRPVGIATITTFRGSTRTQCVRDYADAVAESSTPEWARKGANGVIAASVSNPRLRVVGGFQKRSGTAKRSGNSFTVVEATCRPISLDAQGGELAPLQALFSPGADGVIPMATAEASYNEWVGRLGTWKQG